jgi:DTW domain-containing protein YfiP
MRGHMNFKFCFECRVLFGRCLCDGSIPRPEESRQVWCVWVWFRNLTNEVNLAQVMAVGLQEENRTPKVLLRDGQIYLNC